MGLLLFGLGVGGFLVGYDLGGVVVGIEGGVESWVRLLVEGG